MRFLTQIDLGTPADTQPRLSLQGSATPQILFGAGGASTADVLFARTAAGATKISANAIAATPTLHTIESLAGQTATLDVNVAGDTAHTRLSLRGDATQTGILMGSGTAADILLKRNSAGMLQVTSNGAAVGTEFDIIATSGQTALLSLSVAGETSHRLEWRGDASVVGVIMGGGGGTFDLRAYRSAASTLTIDNNSGGALTTINFLTTNLWQNGAPITAIATQVQRASGAVSDYLAEIKLTADTQYRAILGLDGSSNPQILMGIGGVTAPDIRLYRSAASLLSIDANGATGNDTQVLLSAQASHGAWYSLRASGDTFDRVQLAVNSNPTPILAFGPGNATQDTRIYRSSAGNLMFDANGQAIDQVLQFSAASAHQASIWMTGNATANPQLQLSTGTGTTPAILLGGGAAVADLHIYRSTTSVLKLDADGSGGAITLLTAGQHDFVAETLPATPGSGVGRLYFNSGDKHFHQIDDAGLDQDLVANVTLNFVIDGGGNAITTGIKGDIVIDFPCTITQVTLLADQTGSIVVDIWKDVYANFPPTVADTITASALPTISAATKAQDATMTGWTKTIAAGDILRFNVNSASTVQRVTVSLRVIKT